VNLCTTIGAAGLRSGMYKGLATPGNGGGRNSRKHQA